MNAKCLIALILALFIPQAAMADTYLYKDSKGVLVFTDMPHEGAIVVSPGYKAANSSGTAKYHRYIESAASKYNVDAKLIKAVIKVESNYDETAISKKGAMGLMQLMPGTAKVLGVSKPFNPEQNIDGGTRYLRYLMNRFGGDHSLALAAYNAGPTWVEKYGSVPPIQETKDYVKRVTYHYNSRQTDNSAKAVKAAVAQATTVPKKSAATADVKPKAKPVVYKIQLEDGTIIYTNSKNFYERAQRNN